MWKMILISLAFLVHAQNGTACWAPPQAEVWTSPGDQSYQYRRDNTKGVVTVTDADDRSKVLWTAELKQFDGLFSMVYVVNNGDTVIHLRSNHQVSSVDDLAMEVIYKDGRRQSFTAKKFVPQLRLPDRSLPQMSTAPNSRWIKSTTEVNDERITILTIDDNKVTVDLKS